MAYVHIRKGRTKHLQKKKKKSKKETPKHKVKMMEGNKYRY
jgi:hypothetical protein